MNAVHEAGLEVVDERRSDLIVAIHFIVVLDFSVNSVEYCLFTPDDRELRKLCTRVIGSLDVYGRVKREMFAGS